jgi:DNA polymerase-4
MPSRTAQRLCPHAIFVTPRFDVYHAVSREIMDILAGVTPILEPVALDEAFLDVSDALGRHEDAFGLGGAIKAAITAETQLTASLGIATNKLTAKVASDFRKPDGLTVVGPGEERSFLAPLPVRRLWGIGPKAEERLGRAGVHTAGELADVDPGWIISRFGRQGLEWQRMAQGVDERPVSAAHVRRQLSRERTFPRDIADSRELRGALHAMADELAPLLARHRPARTVTLKLRYADFTTVTRRCTPGSTITADSLKGLSEQLLQDHWSERPVRLLGIAVSNFVDDQPGQLSLF